MTGLLASGRFFSDYADDLERIAGATGHSFEPVAVPSEPDVRLDAPTLETLEVAFFSGDLNADAAMGRKFFGSAVRAPQLRWLHGMNAGMDDPVFATLRERGVRLSSSSGASALPIAQTAIAGLLALARGFPQWGEAQRRHAWEPHPRTAEQRELDEQTLVVVGVGAIGSEIARLGRALGLHVIGVRRSPQREGDHVDEMRAPGELASVLPRADWLAIACPLTDETRGMIDAAALALLPAGARVINIARGAIVDEQAMIEALRGGALGGAYLDVFEEEPLPPQSPLWELSNVLVSPHDSASSGGSGRRSTAMFLANLERYARNEPLANEVTEL